MLSKLLKAWGNLRFQHRYSWWVKAYEAVYYWLAYRLWDPYHQINFRDESNGIGICYHDKDVMMLGACFQILKNYVDNERPFDIIDWDVDDQTRKTASEIKELYHWWTVERPAELKAIADTYNKDYIKLRFEPWEDDPEYSRIVTEGEYPPDVEPPLQRQERLRKKEQEMLHRLIDIRECLWT